MRLINADALYETLCHIWDRTDSEDFEKAVFHEIENAPVVEERKTGKWIAIGQKQKHGYEWMRCSECGEYDIDVPFARKKYCPNCGAKMVGGKDE